MKTKVRKYNVYSYDVWGNARDGFDVNDVFHEGQISIVCKRETFNKGTPHEFHSYEPTNRQLARAAGIKGCEFYGDDQIIYANLKSNGKPVREFRVVESEGA